ncbi:hypothetical protein PgNI_06069, partial [Pyricularia grisea]|uniref:Uncharacterized protein n=1 Tax=Pyricularia grisea TaxID=148305 RepID=A0A6P8B4Y3_PYRGI
LQPLFSQQKWNQKSGSSVRRQSIGCFCILIRRQWERSI